MITQATLYGFMKLCDDFDLLTIDEPPTEQARAEFTGFDHRTDRIEGVEPAELRVIMGRSTGLPLYNEGRMAGFIRTAHEQDASLSAYVLFENLACKATAVLAV